MHNCTKAAFESDDSYGFRRSLPKKGRNVHSADVVISCLARIWCYFSCWTEMHIMYFIGHRVPVNYNSAYADRFNYSLRFYIDEEVPFVAAHGRNAMMGELRKVFALADALRPSGPKYGEWRTKAMFEKPDLVMWVDGDARKSFHRCPCISSN